VRSYVSDSSAPPGSEREAVGAGVRRGRRPVAEKGAAQKDRHWHTCPGVCGGQRRAQSPNGASRIRKAPVETLVSQAPKLIGRNRCQNCRAFAEWHRRGREKRRRHSGGGTRSPAERTSPQARSTAGVFVKEVAGVEHARHAPAIVLRRDRSQDRLMGSAMRGP